MSNISLFKHGGLPSTDIMKYRSAVAASTAAIARTTSAGVAYLNFDRQGRWSTGPAGQRVEIEEGSLWAINPFSACVGFIAWGAEKTPQAGTVLGEVMRPINETPPHSDELQDHGVPWTPQVQLDMICISGEDKGMVARWKTNSDGGRQCYTDIMAEIGKMMEGDDLNAWECVPIIQLTNESYHHKKYGEIFKPIFEVDRWVTTSDKALEAGEQKKAEPAPRRRGAAPAEPPAASRRRPAAEPEKVDRGAVVRRRRR